MIIIKSICLILIFLSISKYPDRAGPKLILTNKDIFKKGQTIIESHRGINREFFENTLEAFNRALNYEIDSIETDVWLTKDNVLAIYHGYGENGQLEGFYDHTGNITELNWRQLSSYKTIWGNLRMPTLRELFRLSKNRILLNLEIKDPRVDILWPHLVKLIEKFNCADQISISSFFYDYYNKTKEYNEEYNRHIPFGFLYHKNETERFIYNKTGNTLNIYYSDASKFVCDKAHQNGMAVLVWFDMIDDENFDVYRTLIDNGVDVICSNEPVLAKKFLNDYYRQYYNKDK